MENAAKLLAGLKPEHIINFLTECRDIRNANKARFSVIVGDAGTITGAEISALRKQWNHIESRLEAMDCLFEMSDLGNYWHELRDQYGV
jgi:hypothetical protein